MKDKMTSLMSLFFLMLGLMTACANTSGKAQPPSNFSAISSLSPSPAPAQNASPGDVTHPDSAIREVDFGNFTFPRLPSKKCSMREIHLVNGRYDAPESLVPHKTPSVDCWSAELTSTSYADITGDGQEEAIVQLYAELGGTEGSADIFIYTLSNNRPLLLWKFMTGDRADGGLRRIYSENGQLVIELFGAGTVVGKQLESSENFGACCPKHFTRTRYRWDGHRFVQDGKEEVLENPTGSTAVSIPNS
jgi:hypothetical protein